MLLTGCDGIHGFVLNGSIKNAIDNKNH